MSRKSPLGTPLWPLIYGLVIVAFSFFLLALRAGIAIFLYGGRLGHNYTLGIFQCKSNTEMRRSIHKYALEEPVELDEMELEKYIEFVVKEVRKTGQH